MPLSIALNTYSIHCNAQRRFRLVGLLEHIVNQIPVWGSLTAVIAKSPNF